MNLQRFSKLGILAEFKNGLNYSKENFGKGIKVIGVRDFQDYFYPKYDQLEEINPKGIVRKEDLLQEGDILFVRSNGNRNLIGRSLFIKNLKEKISHSGFTIRLRFLSTKIYNLFFTYFFKSSVLRRTLSLYGGGANINNLNQKILSELKVPLPPLPIQKKIAAVLSAYDDLIENNNRRITILEKMAEEVYKEWFVRMRFPGHEKVKFVKGIPEGWELKKFDDLFFFEKGKNPPQLYTEKEKGYLKYINVDSIENNNILFVPPIKTNVISYNGETLMLMDGARSGLVFRAFHGVVGSTFSVIRSPDNLKNILYEYLKANKEAIIFNNTGSAIPHANKEFIKRMLIFLPKEEYLIDQFNAHYNNIKRQTDIITQKKQNLKQTRDRLLTRLISGKLSVDNLDIQFPKSMLEEEKMEEACA